jgi:integrase
MPTVRERDGRHQALVRIKKNGVIVHQETKTFDSEKLARAWGEQVEKRIKKVGVPGRSMDRKTLATLLTDYLEALEASSTVLRGRSSELMQLAADKIGHTALTDLQASTFTQFALRRRKDGAGPSTVMHNLATLRAVLNAAKPMFGYDLDGKMVAEAVAVSRRLGAVGKSDSRERLPTAKELDDIEADFNRIAAHPSTVIPMAQIMRLAVELPRRLGELCDIRWLDLDKKKRTVLLRDTKDPNEVRNELIAVPPSAMAIIDTLPVIDERVLPYKPESISAAWQRACARLGIEDLHFHDLRHAGITALFAQGLSIPEVAIISGHKNWAMLRRYTHPSVTALSEKLNAGIEEAPSTGA